MAAMAARINRHHCVYRMAAAQRRQAVYLSVINMLLNAVNARNRRNNQ